jgi:hypothetical protein
MWGASSTGKTTFLAALSVALIRRGPMWRVRGENVDSTEKLIELTMGLTEACQFPAATIGIGHYRWALDGRLPRRVRRRWWWFGSRVREEDVRIHLELVDPQGELARSSKRDRSARGDLVENLVRSGAIVFLFDPIREFERGDAFEHTFGVLQQLSLRKQDHPGRLPHYVAVCVTKFDEVRVLATAEKLGLLSYDLDPPGFPRVADEDAREFFAQLCNVSRSGNADLVLNLLEQHFRADRIKYFITSAIGFYVDPRAGRFDPDDYQNRVQPDPAKPEARIRGSIYPINVVEPVLWLGEKLAGETAETASS